MFASCYFKTTRNFERDKCKDIDKLNTESSEEFWDAVHKLGPQQHNLIPFEMYDNSGEINTDTNFLLNEWSNQFNSLFQGYIIGMIFTNLSIVKRKEWRMKILEMIKPDAIMILHQLKLNLS